MVKKIGDKKEDGLDFGKSKIGPLFDSIFFPTLLSMVFASLFTVADGIFVGQGVGSNALAAINIVSPLFLVTTGIALMFGVGVSVVASIHLSQNNHEEANINITQAFEVATLLMVVIAMAVYLFRIPFLRLLGCSDALLPLGQPARTMETYSLLKDFGWFARASEKVAPPSTWSARSPRTLKSCGELPRA